MMVRMRGESMEGGGASGIGGKHVRRRCYEVEMGVCDIRSANKNESTPFVSNYISRF